MVQPMTFPLYERAVERGVLEGQSVRPCFDGGQGLVFCSSRRGAEKTARFLSEEMKLKIPADTRQEL